MKMFDESKRVWSDVAITRVRVCWAVCLLDNGHGLLVLNKRSLAVYLLLLLESPVVGCELCVVDSHFLLRLGVFGPEFGVGLSVYDKWSR